VLDGVCNSEIRTEDNFDNELVSQQATELGNGKKRSVGDLENGAKKRTRRIDH
jgi:hypothetical protein